MVLTVSFVLSPGTGLSCPRRFEDHPQSLAPASGRQDHTTSPSAHAPFVFRRNRVHRIPRPTFVTIAKRPSEWAGMAIDMDLIWVMREGKYFFARDWTGSISLTGFDKFAVR